MKFIGSWLGKFQLFKMMMVTGNCRVAISPPKLQGCHFPPKLHAWTFTGYDVIELGFPFCSPVLNEVGIPKPFPRPVRIGNSYYYFTPSSSQCLGERKAIISSLEVHQFIVRFMMTEELLVKDRKFIIGLEYNHKDDKFHWDNGKTWTCSNWYTVLNFSCWFLRYESSLQSRAIEISRLTPFILPLQERSWTTTMLPTGHRDSQTSRRVQTIIAVWPTRRVAETLTPGTSSLPDTVLEVESSPSMSASCPCKLVKMKHHYY